LFRIKRWMARLETVGIDLQMSTFCRLAEVLGVPQAELRGGAVEVLADASVH
jgi:hypothetical protein